MFFTDAESALGGNQEGTDMNPIQVPDCTTDTFAHFLMWFNHTYVPSLTSHKFKELMRHIRPVSSPWETLSIPALQGNLDILHISHMWLIKEGVDYAVGQLESVNLPAARRLELARRYGITSWLDLAIRDLLLMPLTTIVRTHIPSIGFETFCALACAKESIEENRRKVSVCLPYPKSFDEGPYCADPARCKEIWFTVWIREICRLIHRNRIRYIPLCDVQEHFRAHAFVGMHPGCKELVINSLLTTNAGIPLEEEIIQEAVREIGRL